MKKLEIIFWKTFAKFWDLRPRLHLPRYSDYPIANTPITTNKSEYEYPEGVKVLFEWDEKGYHWIVFSR